MKQIINVANWNKSIQGVFIYYKYNIIINYIQYNNNNIIIMSLQLSEIRYIYLYCHLSLFYCNKTKM